MEIPIPKIRSVPQQNHRTWSRDMKSNIIYADLSTTGGRLWKAADHMIDFLENWDYGYDKLHQEATDHCRCSNQSATPTINILELGAGCGYLGMCLAENVYQDLCSHEQKAESDAIRMVVTERMQDGGFDHLQNNIQHFLGSGHQHLCRSPVTLHAEELTWSSDLSSINPFISQTHWHWLVASDIVYEEFGVQALMQVLDVLISPCTTFLYSHSKHRFDHIDLMFLEMLSQRGFRVEELPLDPDIIIVPNSPEPFTELFTEKRLIIYKITRQQ